MAQFQLLAQPLWVNLFLLIPLARFSAGEAGASRFLGDNSFSPLSLRWPSASSKPRWWFIFVPLPDCRRTTKGRCHRFSS
jgi:hypothetical protein